MYHSFEIVRAIFEIRVTNDFARRFYASVVQINEPPVNFNEPPLNLSM